MKHFVMDENYDNKAAKTEYIRNQLALLRTKIELGNSLLENPDYINQDTSIEEIKKLVDGYVEERDSLLNVPSLCYTEEELQDSAPKKDLFTELAEKLDDKDLQDIVSDLKAVENSVLDAQIAYEKDEIDAVIEAKNTYDAIENAEMLASYDGSKFECKESISRFKDKELASKAEEAQSLFNDIVTNKNNETISQRLSNEALLEVGRHPFRYSLYAAKQNFKSVMQDISDGRKLVKATEQTFLDSVKTTVGAASYAIATKANDAMSIAMQAGRNACVSAATSLNNAYTNGSELMTKAKEAMKKISASVMEKTDVIAEKLSGGLYSEMLKEATLKAYALSDRTKDTKSFGDSVLEKSLECHMKTHGVVDNDMSTYVSYLKSKAWGDEGKSLFDHAGEYISNKKYEKALKSVERKEKLEAYVEKADAVFEKIDKKMDEFIAKGDEILNKMEENGRKFAEKVVDKTTVASKIATLSVTKQFDKLSISALTSAVRFYEKIHKVNEFRVDKAFDKVESLNDKAFEASASRDILEGSKPEAYSKKTFELPKDVSEMVSALQSLENKGVTESFAQTMIERKIAKQESVFDKEEAKKVKLSQDEIRNWEVEMYTANAIVENYEKDIDKAIDKVDVLVDRSLSIGEKIDSFAKNIQDKVASMYQKSVEIDNLKADLFDKADEVDERDDI